MTAKFELRGAASTGSRRVPLACLRAALMAAALYPLAPALAQDAPLRPGEAFVTRFSGTTEQGGQPALDLNGTVGSIIDLRAPGQPPQGQHWIDEPQRRPITAGEVGQVFGVALDDQPNIYLTSTAAFGLHRTADNAQWMPGMFGPGGPGAIYRLDRNAGYRPALFAQVTLNGRQNTGAGLGNIAYDRWNRQFFVSDLETGMIHRLRADGQDLGVWDHGTQGRANFLDMEAKQPKSLQPVAFNPSSRALIQDCPSGNFAQSPDCWNVAESGRRVWGLGVMRNAQSGETRLYYSVWSSPTFGNAAWTNLPEDEKRNSLWSVRLGPDGGFDPSSVQREFLLPDFFVKPEDVARAGFSQPVSDISFAACGPKPVMLVAERGGLRNLGLAAENAFATPHESRSLRYEYDTQNGWRPVGRYDVGTYARSKEGQPFMRANCSGGVAYGYGYNATYTGVTQPDQFVWNSGDALCSPEGPCNMLGAQVAAGQQPPPPAQLGAAPQQIAAGQGGLPPGQPGLPGQEGEEQQSDDSPVHGIQGLDENAYDEVVPQGAFAEASQTEPYPSTGLSQSYMIDIDVNIGETGGANDAEFSRNDATRIGDVAIFQVCPTQAMGFMPLPPPPVIAGHVPAVSHAMYASHGRAMSHYRFGSHAPEFSHHRFRSHYRHWSHHRFGSHERHRSHYRWGSHNQRESHSRLRSHNRTLSHYRSWSHNPVWSHRRLASHDLRRSHHRWGSHNARESHQRLQSHVPSLSHTRLGSHNRALSHVRTGSHNPLSSHVPSLSHSKQGSHTQVLSHNRAGSINVPAAPTGPTHSRQISLGKPTAPVHLRAISAGPVKPVHSRAISLANTKPVHSRSISIGSKPVVRPIVRPKPIVKPKPIVTPKPVVRPRPAVKPRPVIQQPPQRSLRQSGMAGSRMAGPGFVRRF
jgi:hypothetical protein